MKPSHLNNKGYPLDYHEGSLTDLGQFRLDFYRNSVDRVLTRDPYAAMLMAIHGVALMNGGYGKYTYLPDRTAEPRVKAYVDHQEDLRIKLLAQFVCNRYPLNSKARKLGPSKTLNDVDVPTRHAKSAVK